MSFCHEAKTEAAERGAVGTGGTDATPAPATAGQQGPTLGIEPRLFRGHSVDSANRRGVAILARAVSFAFALRASAQTVGRGRGLAECMAHPAGRVG